MPGEIMTFDDYVVATSEPGTDPYREPPVRDYNARTQKLKVTGDGHRDRLVAARLRVRRTQED